MMEVLDDPIELNRRLAAAEAEIAALRANGDADRNLRIMADAAPILIWETDATGVTFVNQHYLDFFGVSFAEIKEMGWSAFLHPDDIEGYVNAYVAGFTARQPYAYECRFRRADGLYRWLRNTGTPAGDDRFAGGSVDITDLIELQSKLKESEEQLRLVKETGRHLAILTTDPAGVVTSWSKGAEDTFGWSEAEVIGQPVAMLFTPEDQAAGAHEQELSRAAEDGCAPDERWHLTKGGCRVFLNGSVHPLLPDADGHERGFMKIARDDTRRREIADERDQVASDLRTLNETLESRVAQRTAELMQAEEALRQSQKMEAVGQLTGGVAHDFNNLLTVIRGSVDLLRRPDLSEAKRQRYIDAVSDTVDRAAKLTGQLLAFARRSALKPEVFDVRTKLSGVGEMIDTVTGSRVRVAVKVPNSPCFVRADLSQFETALINLSVNARDAMVGEGQLELTVSCGERLPAIRGHAGSGGLFTAVTVRDTGCGIPADQLGNIFEPFYTTKEVGKGTGLGLSQVFGFAKQSGGDVDVASILGEGATFTLYLPEVPEPAHVNDDRDNAGLAPTGQGLRVLVVEDNIEVGRFCVQILEDLGYSPTLAPNAEEALERLEAEGDACDVVFSDVVMPGMGGVELAKRLRSERPGLPVVLASGYSHVLANEDDHGFELLHKPYSADQLASVLRTVTARA